MANSLVMPASSLGFQKQVVAAEDGEAHCEPVVAVGLDFDAGHEWAGMDFQRVIGFDHMLAEFF